jgi:hypothetical protein
LKNIIVKDIENTIMETTNNIFKKVGNKNPFTTPDNYFEDFSANMEELIDKQEEETIVVRISFWHRVQPYLYLAAMFVGLYISINTFIKPSIEKKQEENRLVEMSVQRELLLDEIDEYVLYELISYNN